MWLSKLNEMSVGPLWVLRAPVAQPRATCPVCGQAWATENAGTSWAILAAPITDPTQQALLQNCLHAIGWDEAGSFNLHGACASPAALQALQEQQPGSDAQTLIVFGAQAARLIDPGFERGQVHQWQGSRLIVTYHPEEMIANPALKAEVWSDLCMATHAD
ncbi:hypothetical protein AAKU67_000157 [Oxalobacteraceae bacterium GrIS 2.11]